MKTRFSAIVVVLLLAMRGYAGQADLGINASLNGAQVLPKDDAWNADISAEPIDPASAVIIEKIGGRRPLHPDFGTVINGQPNGIPYIVVSGDTAKVPVAFQYADESDKGPYAIPANAPIEGGAGSDGDRHVIVIDRDHWLLYELWSSKELDGGQRWEAGSGAIFDLMHGTIRPAGWTSADAAGLPIFPGLVRYDEVVDRGEITHALRFTIQKSRHAYIAPARHFASQSNDPALAPMGMRVRLKAGFDVSKFSPPVQVILKALKRYGMILADNGGDWFISGAPDSRWDDDQLHQLTRVKGDDLEVVRMGPMTTR
jgi:hypothetical protein